MNQARRVSVLAWMAIGAISIALIIILTRPNESPQLRDDVLSEISEVSSGSAYVPRLPHFGEWNRLYIVRSYSTAEDLYAAIGRVWDGISELSQLGEGESGLVLLDGDHVVAWTKFNGFELSTGGIEDQGRPFARRGLAFTVDRSTSDGRVPYLTLRHRR